MINGNYADEVTIGNLRQLILLSGTEGNASEEPVAAWRAEAAVDGTGQLELFLDGSGRSWRKIPFSGKPG